MLHPRLNTLLAVATFLFSIPAYAASGNPVESSSAPMIEPAISNAPVQDADATKPASAPGAEYAPKYSLDVAITLNPMLADAITSKSFWMMGGGIQLHWQFYRNWGVVADISGLRTSNINSTGVGLGMITTTFGPRYTWAPAHRKYSLFAQGLIGLADGFSGVFPTAGGAISSDNSLATLAGGGLNYSLSPRISLRGFEVDWLRTQLPNSTTNVQNNVRIGAGVAFHFR